MGPNINLKGMGGVGQGHIGHVQMAILVKVKVSIVKEEHTRLLLHIISRGENPTQIPPSLPQPLHTLINKIMQVFSVLYHVL